MPGPVPKRTNQRRRRPAAGQRPQTVEIVGTVEIPAKNEHWHPIAASWYDSLAESAQSRFYEPSDWAYAVLWTEVLSRQLEGGRMSARMMATWQTASNDLLTTEASRRRVRMEVERRALTSVPAPTTLEGYRDL